MTRCSIDLAEVELESIEAWLVEHFIDCIWGRRQSCVHAYVMQRYQVQGKSQWTKRHLILSDTNLLAEAHGRLHGIATIKYTIVDRGKIVAITRKDFRPDYRDSEP